MANTCKTCRYSHGWTKRTIVQAQCRRFPKQWVDPSGLINDCRWPRVSEDEWCGEWQSIYGETLPLPEPTPLPGEPVATLRQDTVGES